MDQKKKLIIKILKFFKVLINYKYKFYYNLQKKKNKGKNTINIIKIININYFKYIFFKVSPKL